MIKNLLSVVFLICISINTYAASINSYTTADIAKIAMVLGIIILIFSPSKFRIVVIGTILGLSFAYFTYKYIVPIFVSSLQGP